MLLLLFLCVCVCACIHTCVVCIVYRWRRFQRDSGGHFYDEGRRVCSKFYFIVLFKSTILACICMCVYVQVHVCV